MSIIVKGEKIRLLELSMIRRYGSHTPIVDPAVARILVNKGLAIYIDKKEEKKEEDKKEDVVVNNFSENTLFPTEIISEV